MTNPRAVAIWVAVLFIIGTAASVAGDMLLAPLRGGAMPMAAFAGDPARVVTATLFFLFACTAIAAIPIVWFPVLRLQTETGALLYVATRLAEALLFVLGAIFTLALVQVAGATEPNQGLFDIVDRLGLQSYTLGTMIVFGISAIILAVLLYQTRLVPRWLSLWKGLGAVLLILQGVLILYEAATPMLEQTLYLPIAVNEMVLALWLLIKGFSAEALAKLERRAV